MSTDDKQPLSGSNTPFSRGTVTWGRPPQTVFRAGPLPKGERLPPLPEPSSATPVGARVGSGILGGSLIPQAPVPSPAPTSTPIPAPTPAPASVPAPEPRARAPEPDLTVRPLPAPEPAHVPILAEPVVAEPVVAGTAPPRAEPAPGVSPVLATASARRSGGRLPLYAGVAVAVVAVAAVGVWMLTRPPAAPPAVEVAVPPAVLAPQPDAEPLSVPIEAEAVALEETVSQPVAAPPPAAAAPASPVPARREAAPPPAVQPAPVQPAQATPTLTPPTGTVAPSPLIEIVPAQPAGPPPTSAERPPVDPDAPITTRPQPLN